MNADIPDFFISYTAVDSSWAEWVAWTLEDAGFTTVIQAWDFQAGRNFVQLMDEAATTSKRTIAILSENYLKSVFGKSELYAAFARDPESEGRTLIPVRVDECDVKGLLAQIIYVDLVGVDEVSGKQKLISAVINKRMKPEIKPSFPGDMTEKPKFPGPSADLAQPRTTSPVRQAAVIRPQIVRGMRKAISDDLRLEQDAADTASKRLQQLVFALTFGLVIAIVFEGVFYMELPLIQRVPLALLIGYVFAWIVAKPITSLLTKLLSVRRWLLRGAWIEGFWHIKTFDFGSSEPESTGLVEMQFRGFPLRLHVRITKLRSAETPHPTTSKSEEALLSANLKYWNKWSYTTSGDTTTGYASGVFEKKPPSAPFPNDYQGVLIFSDGRAQKMQRAIKIPESRIRELSNAHGERWRDALLHNLEESQF